MNDSKFHGCIRDALLRAGENSNIIEIRSSPAGGNNRGFVISTDDMQKYFIKCYYSHPSDTRHRLKSEYDFLVYAWNKGIRSVPKPIAKILDKNIAIYEYIAGKKLIANELSQSHIISAADFILDLNLGSKQNPSLPMASGSAFNITDHFNIISKRLNNLKKLPERSDIDHQAKRFIIKLENTWLQIKNTITSCSKLIEMPLQLQDRCISPSDFGFHNALQTGSGKLYFLDFEYAGWDDPAKMCGDFFCQPEVPISLDYFNTFTNKALSYSVNSENIIARTKILLPIFQLKWCCIMLNEFLPNTIRRRRFANVNFDLEQSKRLQLKKAQYFFQLRLVQ